VLVRLRYAHDRPLSLRGPRTGRVYQVSGSDPVVSVARDDAPSLLRTGLFSSERE
jgi:hypothetical protein